MANARILKIGAQVLCSTCLTLVAIPANAQDERQSAEGEFPAQEVPGTTNPTDIIVTARRTDERLQDVPISITVFDQERLSQNNIVKAEDLSQYTPSLSTNTSFGSDNSTFAIRGFVQDLGTAPSVGVYFADVVAPRGGNAAFPTGDGAGVGSFFDLENIQVLRGPQGTLFGRNTTGGAVLLVPRKPTAELEGYGEVSVGNYDMLRTQGVLNLPVSDAVRLRVGVDHMSRDGYLQNFSKIGPDDFADIGYIAARASVVVELTPNLENYLIATYSNSENNGPLQKVVACNPGIGLGDFACGQIAQAEANGEGFYDVRSDVPNPLSKVETWQLINTTTFDASDNLTIRNIISYGQLNQNLRTALFGTQFVTPAIPNFLPSVPFNFASVNPAPNGNGFADQSTFTEELQFQGQSLDDRLDWQFGAYYEQSKPLGLVGSQSPQTINCTDTDTLQCTDILGFLANLDPNVTPLIINGVIPPIQVGSVNYSVSEIDTRSIGLYSQASFHLTEQLTVTGGLRYTWDRQRSDTDQITYLFPTFPNPVGPASPTCTRLNTTLPDCSLNLVQKSDAPTWLLGIDYEPTPDMLLYAKYSRGYRTGGIKSDAPVSFAIFEPESVDSYEIGAKIALPQIGNGFFNIAAFYNDFSNQQLQVGFGDNPAVPGGVSSTAGPFNAGQSRIYGLEVDAGAEVFDGFRLTAAYAYLNTKIEFVIAPTLPANDPFIITSTLNAGDELVLAPEHQLVLSANYLLPLPSSIGDVSLGMVCSYTSEQQANYSPTGTWEAFLRRGSTTSTCLEREIY